MYRVSPVNGDRITVRRRVMFGTDLICRIRGRLCKLSIRSRAVAHRDDGAAYVRADLKRDSRGYRGCGCGLLRWWRVVHTSGVDRRSVGPQVRLPILKPSGVEIFRIVTLVKLIRFYNTSFHKKKKKAIKALFPIYSDNKVDRWF